MSEGYRGNYNLQLRACSVQMFVDLSLNFVVISFLTASFPFIVNLSSFLALTFVNVKACLIGWTCLVIFIWDRKTALSPIWGSKQPYISQLWGLSSFGMGGSLWIKTWYYAQSTDWCMYRSGWITLTWSQHEKFRRECRNLWPLTTCRCWPWSTVRVEIWERYKAEFVCRNVV